MAVDLVPDEWRMTIDDRCIALWRNRPITKTAGPRKGETVMEWVMHTRYYSTPELAAAGILRVLVAEQADTTTATELLTGLDAALARLTAVLDDAGAVKPRLIAEQDDARAAAAAKRLQTA